MTDVKRLMPGGDCCPDCHHEWARHIQRGQRHQCMVRSIEQGSGNFEGCGCGTVPPAQFYRPARFGSQSGRITCDKPNFTEQEKRERWILHGKTAHVDGEPCAKCGTQGRPAKRVQQGWSLQVAEGALGSWFVRLVRPIGSQRVDELRGIFPNYVLIAGPVSREIADAYQSVFIAWASATEIPIAEVVIE